jgi:predicted transcriptional regulator
MRVLQHLRDAGENDISGLRDATGASNSTVSNAIVQLLRAGLIEIVDATMLKNRKYRFYRMPDPADLRAPTRRALEVKFARPRRARNPANVTPPPYRSGLAGWGRWR